MTDKGLLTMDLVCPEGHVAGQLIQNIKHQAIGIEVPDRGREEWPRGGDNMYTLLTCHGCNRRFMDRRTRSGRGPLGSLRLSPSGSADTRCATLRTA
jgi:hypothetical protein